MENIIRGTTPSLIVDFEGITDFTVQDIAGYVTKKGEVIRFDYDKDGNYDLLRYDGGRAETSLAPGKIDGWHVVDKDENILGTYYKGEFTPVE